MNLTDASIVKDSITNCKDSEVTINLKLQDLESSTRYYFKPFIIINGQTTLFGESDFFATSEDLRIGDLGLSVKWATRNIGANSPEEIGGYYAWGEVKEKDIYTLDTYTHYDKSTHKYTLTQGSIVGTEHDVARQEWGSKWRMPTHQEAEELRVKCKWELITYNDVLGHKVTGPSGKSIFIPLTGYKSTKLGSTAYAGYYWCGTKHYDYGPYVLSNQNRSDNPNWIGVGNTLIRTEGYAVRAVRD